MLISFILSLQVQLLKIIHYFDEQL